MFLGSKINYLVFKNIFKKYHANIGKCDLGTSCHKKDNDAIHFNLEARFNSIALLVSDLHTYVGDIIMVVLMHNTRFLLSFVGSIHACAVRLVGGIITGSDL